MSQSNVRRMPFLISMLLSVLTASLSLPACADALDIRAWPAGRATPPLRLDDLEGRAWRLADLRGRVVIVNFWATWCEACVDELPFLNEIAAAQPDKLVVLGINFKEPATQVARFSAARKLAYPILLDTSGASFTQWAGAVLPTTILVDRKGRARWRVVGALDADDRGFRQALAQLLKE